MDLPFKVLVHCNWQKRYNANMDRRGRDRMVVKFTTSYAISAYHH